MSGKSEPGIPVAGDATQIEARAVAWVRRRHFETWTEKDQAELHAWLAQSLAHRVAYWRMNAGFERIGRLAVLRSVAPEPETKARSRNFRRALGGSAAAIFVAASLSLFFLTQEMQAYSTPVGGRQTVALSDGSHIELNTDTSLHTRVSLSGERDVWLDKGEAYFQVKHDAAHPFVVNVAGHRVTDLGTKFLVRNGVDRVEITLVEGRARVDSTKSGSQSAMLWPGDVAVATENSVSVKRKPLPELANALGWRHGVLVFKRTMLSDAAAEFNRYNDQKIIIADASAAHLTIDGTFPSNGIGLFARSAEKVFELHVVKRGNETVISR